LIKASAPACRRDHIPQTDAPLRKPPETRVIFELMKLFVHREA